MIYRTVTFLAIALLLLLQNGCGTSPESGRLHIVVSISPFAYFAERIGGEHVDVSVMVPPGGNPHSYEPTPRQMSALSGASLFVKAGSGVEFELDWMPRILSLNPELRICDASEGVPLIPMHQEDAQAHEDSASGQTHQHGRYDPHYWLSPDNAVLITRNIEKALGSIDPSHRPLYAANAATLVAELQALRHDIHEQLAPVRNRNFLVFHPAWGYYADAFGLKQIAAEEEGKTMTPLQLQRVIEKARDADIRVVFVSPQFGKVQAETIAGDIGGTTGTVDPLARDYIDNLRKATDAFTGAMQ
ncbi:MAG: zinc ABC transporter substrate-binding protein [Chlorobium sp.]|jgi:zinc transport system substrate-binding protein|uniref:metal ABC transporter solute-binding protein, Zn/Mn family n=1 Tax=Chlorobium sp. TaxID=1095 RepID=UPI001D6A1FEE|nr:zinc ABC transporter substrate-binding protein [Chlorobium sp.]MBN1278678.1 zinc ABC transporter substrate-binding protein [Chlorobiaceae bacterium]MCF8216677.1 zinc ABC transporter substrate-binding protein [Chlorobium sp.]MCF8270862.1 zinc ABC transporter substrate-binding protein [Chlorobium sp.]MCF8287204.1 zinc ABC transporter substrate-binding protein [Chlorobium sp.]MCF8290861.1 zinc ABC transporter substrate-binding protein [Chlorobium sp.]